MGLGNRSGPLKPISKGNVIEIVGLCCSPYRWILAFQEFIDGLLNLLLIFNDSFGWTMWHCFGRQLLMFHFRLVKITTCLKLRPPTLHLFVFLTLRFLQLAPF